MSDSQSSANPLAIWRWPLHWQVLIGILMGFLWGWLSGRVFFTAGDSIAHRWDMEVYGLIGTLFMNGLKMLIVPLVMTSIISSIGSLGNQQGFARMGLKTLMYYICTSLIAILIGLFLVNLIQPGSGAGITAEEAASAVSDTSSSEAAKMKMLQSRTEGKGIHSTLNVFKELLPGNIFAAMANMKMLGMIVFSLLFGFYITRMEGDHQKVLVTFFEGAFQVMMKMTFLVLKFLPIGVACLIAKTAAGTFAQGNVLERLGQLSSFALTVVLALGAHAFVVMPLILIFLAKVNPLMHFKAIGQAMMTAFSTASSSATLPVTMNCVERRAGVSKRVTSFVLPVGATVNMDGTALYECVAVLFLAQLSGIQLDVGAQFLVVMLALLTSIGVAGIPSASLVAIVIILNAVNDYLPAGQSIPMEALAVILIFDRLLDMCRTAVNITGDTCGTVLIAKSEGEDSVLSISPDEREKMSEA